MKNIYVVVPNWNGSDMIAEALRSLESQSFKPTIVVVDNGSTDDSVAIIERDFSDVTLIKETKNHGFAGGVNIGIRHALDRKAEAVALFNNDAVADKHWLRNLVDTLSSNANLGIVSAKQLRTDKLHIDSTGDQYSRWGLPFPRGRNEVDHGQYDKIQKVFSAPGGASLYRTDMMNEVGLFDEKFFAYYEDVDISFRARLAGWDIRYEPSAIAYHQISATASKHGQFTKYHSTKNFLMLYFKNMPGWLFWKYLPLLVLQALGLAAKNTLRRNGLTFLRAVWWFISHLPEILSERSAIQGNRKTSLSAIDSLIYKQRPPKIPSL